MYAWVYDRDRAEISAQLPLDTPYRPRLHTRTTPILFI